MRKKPIRKPMTEETKRKLSVTHAALWTPERRAEQSARFRKEFAAGTRKPPVMTDELREKRRQRLLANPLPRPTAAQLRKRADNMRGRKQEPDVVEKRSAPQRGRPARHPKRAKGPSNMGSVSGVLVSPTGEHYAFRNVQHFVRENPFLFLPEDVEWHDCRSEETAKGRAPQLKCRASKGVAYVVAGKPGKRSWKGWMMFRRD
jgi:hypothetical protein